jgi:hypothetical protein
MINLLLLQILLLESECSIILKEAWGLSSQHSLAFDLKFSVRQSLYMLNSVAMDIIDAAKGCLRRSIN